MDTYATLSIAEVKAVLKLLFEQVIRSNINVEQLELELLWKESERNKGYRQVKQEINFDEINNTISLEWISLIGNLKNYDPNQESHVGLIISCHFSSDIQKATNLEMQIHPKLFSGKVNKKLQDAVVNATINAFGKLKGVTGYITLDSVFANATSLSPYEEYVGLPYQLAANDLLTKVRGYFWGNFLSAKHCQILGGESILQKAPVEIYKKINNEQYYLQLTKDKLRKLKSFLGPLLPSGITNALIKSQLAMDRFFL